MKTLMIILCLLLGSVGMAMGFGSTCLVTGTLVDSYTHQGVGGVFITVANGSPTCYTFTQSDGRWDCYSVMADGYYVSYNMMQGCYYSPGMNVIPNPGFSTIINAGTTYLNAIDSDSDRLCDPKDNCTNVNNANGFGTCTKGKVGNSCFGEKLCGCKGYCSSNQEDADGDGIGDACDDIPGRIIRSGLIYDRDIGISEVEGMIREREPIGVIVDDPETPIVECPYM